MLFGSGARAGVDRREQKKQAAVYKASLLRKMRESQVRCWQFAEPWLLQRIGWPACVCRRSESLLAGLSRPQSD